MSKFSAGIMRRIIARHAEEAGVSVERMLAKQTPHGVDEVAYAARTAAALEARDRGYSFSLIGKALGGRDHTTVIHWTRNFPSRAPRIPSHQAALTAAAKLLSEAANDSRVERMRRCREAMERAPDYPPNKHVEF